MAKTKIAVKKCDSYVQSNVDKAVKEIFDYLGGIKKFVKKGDKVLLKVNLLAPGSAEKARTTHPAVAIAVAKIVKKAGGVVSIGDSPAIRAAKFVAKSNGLYDLCQKHGFRFVDFNTAVDTKHPSGKMVKIFPLADEVRKADVIINLPKIKTHGLTALTCCVKNNFGCVVGIRKGQYHMKFPQKEDFSRMLLDLYECVRPELTIVDGITAMQGKGGPGHGDPVDLGILVGGTECVAMDFYICNLLGIDPVKVSTNAVAKKEGYGIADPDKVIFVGDEVKAPIDFEFRPVGREVLGGVSLRVVRWLNDLLTAKPKVRPHCVGCGDCARVCPAKAITMVKKDGKKMAKINHSKCIKCYCCHEVCRYKAINLRRPFLGRLLGL